MQDTGSTLSRRQLGRYLMEWRTRAGLTLTTAAELLETSVSGLHRLEHGRTGRVRTGQIEAACELYGVPEELTAAFVGLAGQAAVRSWWHEFGDLIPKDFDVYFGLESAAVAITTFQPELVPGLFQTADYVRALNRAKHPDATQEQHEGWVQLKMKRQHKVTRTRRPIAVGAVIGEAALRRINGGPRTMAAQMRKLADMSTLPNIDLRILPFRAGFPTGRGLGPCVILDFGSDRDGMPVEPPVVFIEGSSVGNLYLEKPDDVASYHRTYDSIRRRTLDEVDSRSLLRQVAKEYLP